MFIEFRWRSRRCVDFQWISVTWPYACRCALTDARMSPRTSQNYLSSQYPKTISPGDGLTCCFCSGRHPCYVNSALLWIQQSHLGSVLGSFPNAEVICPLHSSKRVRIMKRGSHFSFGAKGKVAFRSHLTWQPPAETWCPVKAQPPQQTVPSSPRVYPTQRLSILAIHESLL